MTTFPMLFPTLIALVSLAAATTKSSSSSSSSSSLRRRSSQAPQLTKDARIMDSSTPLSPNKSTSRTWASSTTASTLSIVSPIPANPIPYQELQPDGSLTPYLYYHGDYDEEFGMMDCFRIHYPSSSATLFSSPSSSSSADRDADGDGGERYARGVGVGVGIGGGTGEGYVVVKDDDGWFVYAEEAEVEVIEVTAEETAEDVATESAVSKNGVDGDDGSRRLRRPSRDHTAAISETAETTEMVASPMKTASTTARTKIIKPGKHRVGSIDPSTVPGLAKPKGISTSFRNARRLLSKNRQERKLNQQLADPFISANQVQIVLGPLTSTDTSSSEEEAGRLRIGADGTKTFSTIGTFRSLILLIRFSDHTDRKLPTREDYIEFYNSNVTKPTSSMDSTASMVDSTKNGGNVPTGSVHQVLLQNSYGQLQSRAYVTQWITVSGSEQYYANGEYGFNRFKEAVAEALDIFVESVANGESGEESGVGLLAEGLSNVAKLLQELDLDGDGTIDGLGVLHSGYGAEYGGVDCHGTASENRIWSHQAGGLQWTHPLLTTSPDGGATGTNNTNSTAVRIPSRYYVASSLRNKCNGEIVRVGIVAHEIGHQLGLPDLYDKTWEGNGIGNYDLMCRCWGWDGTGLYPPSLSPWSKITLGWIKPVEINTNGKYHLSPSAFFPQVYIVKEGYPKGEYLLIENRRALGFDAQLPSKPGGSGASEKRLGGGLAIWHIDENSQGQSERGFQDQQGWPQNGKHYKVALVQADGYFDLEEKANFGDDGDLFHAYSTFDMLGPSLTSIGEYVVPNTDAYQGGDVYETRIWIHQIQDSENGGNGMSFSVKGLQREGAVGGSTSYPTASPPTKRPTAQPTKKPTTSPTSSPTQNPTSSPTHKPTDTPTAAPTNNPTVSPTPGPTKASSSTPSESPTLTDSPTQSISPSFMPSTTPSESPSQSHLPSSTPSSTPSTTPTASITPTLSNTPTSTTSPSTPPTPEPLIYYPNWEAMGCNRKPLSRFSAWEKMRYKSLYECCITSMKFQYSGCINNSIQLIYFDSGLVGEGEDLPQEVMEALKLLENNGEGGVVVSNAEYYMASTNL